MKYHIEGSSEGLFVSDVCWPFPILHRATCSPLPHMAVTKINETRSRILGAALQNPKHDFSLPLGRRLFTENSGIPRKGKKCRYSLCPGGSWGSQLLESRLVFGGPPQAPGVGQGRPSAGKNESLVRAPGKAHSALSSSREIAFLLIFCTVSFFIFKYTFICSCRRKPCTVLETEKGFLGHLSQDGRIFLCPADRERLHF